VLPFKPLVADSDDEQLQLGLTEAVIHQLGRIESVKVEPIARVRRYSSPEQDPVAAGRSLGVDGVVSGYVHQSERGVLVRIWLRRTSDGAVLMTRDSTDQPFRDVLEAQSQMSDALIVALQPALTSVERARVSRPDTTNPEAFRHYLFGRYHMEVRTATRMREAEREFREAITLDPKYARAHAALSVALTHSAFLGDRDGVAVMGAAKAAATRALEIDDSVALAHTALGYVLECFEYDQVRSQSEHLRAMALDDHDLWVVRAYASFLMRRGAFDESLAVIQRAVELDPVSPLSNRHHAMLLYAARRYDECIALTRRTLSLDPTDSALSYSWLGRCLEAQGKPGDAVEAYEDGRSARGNPALARRMKRLYHSRGWDAYWREQLRMADENAAAAAALARLGRLKEAVDVYERGVQLREPWVGYINHPQWDPLLQEPRFQVLRQRLGVSNEMSAQLAAARASAVLAQSR
jgi:TolB-like protein/Flp pilus assembly protein TadD